MNLLSNEHKPFLLFVLFITIARLITAPNLGLGADEAHYVIYALHLDWSYFDHPPLVGWVQYIFTSIFGLNEFGARVSAITIGALVSYFIYRLLYQISSNSMASFVGVLALNASFLFNALFLMLMPDTLLFLLIIPIIFSVIEVEKNNSLKAWLILGLLLGLAGLSKYTAVLFIFPIILYYLIKKRFDLFYSPKIIPAILLAFIIILPVIYWNMEHNWISFTYQSNHVVGERHINWDGFGTSIAGQFFGYNPFLFFVAFFGLYKAFRSKNDTLFLSALFGLVLFAFFTYSSLYKTALPHWSALFYMLFIPVGAYYMLELSRGFKRYIKFAIGFGLVISSLVYIEVATKIVPIPDESSLQIDIYGFKDIMKEANKQIHDPNKEVLAVTHWSIASRAIFYNAGYDSNVYLLDDRYDQFDIWNPKEPIGKDVIVIDINILHRDTARYMKCESVKKLEGFNVMLDKTKKDTIELVKCTNYQGLK